MPGGLSSLKKYRLPGGASRGAALLLPHIFPICSVVAPCPPGAALRNPVLLQRRQATSRWLRGCLAACALTLAVPVSAQIVAPSLGLGDPVVSQSVAIDARPVSDPALLELIETRVGT